MGVGPRVIDLRGSQMVRRAIKNATWWSETNADIKGLWREVRGDGRRGPVLF